MELSIVLVVVGLVVGGVATGQALIKASEVRSVLRDLQRYQTATHTFYDRYNSLPGDMTNATAYWGAQDAGDGLGADCTGVASTGTATCNGSGDNHIGESASYYYEDFRFWQHLANAQMIEGTYTGKTGGGGTQNCGLGTNCPRARIAGTGFAVQYYSAAAGSFLGTIKGNLLLYGAETAASFTNGAALLPEDAWGIDVKIDDGLPGYGDLQQYTNATLANCITDTRNFNLSSTTHACAFIYDLGI